MQRINAGLKLRLAWFAGVVDGEGSLQFRIGRKGRHANIGLMFGMRVYNTDKAMIVEIARILDLLNTRYHIRAHRPANPNARDAWWIEITGRRNLEPVLRALKPYLVTKRPHVELMFLALRRRRQLRPPRAGSHEHIYNDAELVRYAESMTTLNHRGRRSWSELDKSLDHHLGHAQKLTATDVVAIRSRHALGETETALATTFGVSQPMIGYIVRREVWRETL